MLALFSVFQNCTAPLFRYGHGWETFHDRDRNSNTYGDHVYKLIIGNKNYSSWSLRPWLLMKEIGIDFEEVRIPLFKEGYKDEILKHSPSGKVPCLYTDEIHIWDSLAICEYLAEQVSEGMCWPKEPINRAIARSVSNEMHSGFFELRSALPMNCRRSAPIEKISPQLQEEIDRVAAIWNRCRNDCEGGDFLFGSFSIADAMYAPVVLRFDSYGIKMTGQAERYMETILSLQSLQQWIREAEAEIETIALYDSIS